MENKNPKIHIKWTVDKEESKAKMTIEDGNGNVKYSQNYGYTDAKGNQGLRTLHPQYQNDLINAVNTAMQIASNIPQN